MDDRLTIIIDDDTNLNRCAVSPWPDEHCHRRVASCEHSPVMSISVQHVVISDTVLAGARLDVHLHTLPEPHQTSTYIDERSDSGGCGLRIWGIWGLPALDDRCPIRSVEVRGASPLYVILADVGLEMGGAGTCVSEGEHSPAQWVVSAGPTGAFQTYDFLP